MSDPERQGSTRASQHLPAAPRRRPVAVLSMLLPALTFLVGLLIGFAVWGGSPAAEGSGAAGEPSPTTAPGSPEGTGDDRTVTVPAECLRAVDESDALLATVDEAVGAARDLDAARLQQVLDRLQGGTERVRALGEDCRARVEVSRVPRSGSVAD